MRKEYRVYSGRNATMRGTQQMEARRAGFDQTFSLA